MPYSTQRGSKQMTYEASFRVRNQGTFTRSFDDLLPGGRDIDSQILREMATEFGVPLWHVVLRRVRGVAARFHSER